MKYLLFKLINEDISYAVVSPKVLYLLHESEYSLLKDSESIESLNGINQIGIEEISSFFATKSGKEVSIFNLKGKEVVKLSFESATSGRHFINNFAEFIQETDTSKARIKPLSALLLMLFTYSFIWAGTRPTPADITPEGIRWRLAYWNVKLLEWLNALIGQKQLLIIGVVLLTALVYLVFRPEIRNLFWANRKYVNRKLLI